MAHHHEALIETLNKMACAGVELRELAFGEKDYLALAGEIGIDDPNAPLRHALVPRKTYGSIEDIGGSWRDEVVSIRVPDSFVFHGPTGAVRIRNVDAVPYVIASASDGQLRAEMNRRVVEATAPVARVPNADAMRFTCADGTTVDVAMQALLRATADARSEKAAERRYETLSGDPLMDAAMTVATAPDRPHAALEAIGEDIARMTRDMAASGVGLMKWLPKHDRIGSKCTLPNCPHPHDPAPAWKSVPCSCGRAMGDGHAANCEQSIALSRESLRKMMLSTESGPGIARVPEPRPEPLAFLDTDLLCEDE